jgi:hypothetical protein
MQILNYTTKDYIRHSKMNNEQLGGHAHAFLNEQFGTIERAFWNDCELKWRMWKKQVEI